MRYERSFGSASLSVSPTQQLAISRFVSRTYGWMFLGLALTGIVSFFTASSETIVRAVLMNRWAFLACVLGEFALVMGLSAGYQRLSATAATLGFLAYSALNGVTFAVIFLSYTMDSIANVFFITAGMFGGLALFGTITRKNLTGIGTFVGMGLWGLILMSLLNMFLRSNSLNLGLAAAGVLIFSGLTAYDAQRIRAMAYQYATGGSDEGDKGAVFGALMLYLNFINLFLSLLRLFGSRRD